MISLVHILYKKIEKKLNHLQLLKISFNAYILSIVPSPLFINYNTCSVKHHFEMQLNIKIGVIYLVNLIKVLIVYHTLSALEKIRFFYIMFFFLFQCDVTL